MKVLDTNTLTHLYELDARVVARRQAETEELATTIINYAETVRGRYASLFAAANGQELQRGQRLLDETMRFLAGIPRTLPVDAAAADQFDHLLQNKRLRKIRRADLLIAAITLANRATLVTRNLKDFRLVPGLRVENWID